MRASRSYSLSKALLRTLALCSTLVLLHSPPARGDEHHKFAVRALSTKAEMVSGGDVLVQIDVPSNVAPGDLQIDLNGRDITASFRPAAAGSVIGLVQRLSVGRNTLSVSSAGRGKRGVPTERLALVNHPISGPVFSGPQQKPFFCETQTFDLAVTGGTLGAPLDADCSIATRVDYVYMSTGGTLKPLPNPAVRPADLATATRKDGRSFKYIVRVETGTINRAIYQIAVLHDPVVEGPISPWSRPAGWNARLLYSYGGGCGTGYHQGHYQGASLNVLNSALVGNAALAEGYAIAASSLNVFGVTCNDVISAETTMMVKEHFIETFGAPDFTIGVGASGGSMQQHMIAFNYPGLLDGINPARSFPDTLTFEAPYQDCDLLVHAFATSTQTWTLEQKTAVAGHRTYAYCSQNVVWGRLVQPDFASPAPPDTFPGCAPSVPLMLRYNALSNPGGVRCTLFDNMVNVYGRDRRTGFGRRPIDNVGVQYGLNAFNAGIISAEQFIDLNARIGGYDIDGNHSAGRTVADPDALRIAYATGRINSGRDLNAIPMIDSRAYRDDVGDVHDAVRSYVMRARLIAANGNADNQVIFTAALNLPFMPNIYFDHVMRMDEWLTRIARDTSPHRSAAEKVVRNKPADLVDSCFAPSGEKITDLAVCRQLHPVSLEPRLAAGEPLANDILKCALKHVDRRDYRQPFTEDQLDRLQAVFPQGVCDYSRGGVRQHPARGTWITYPRTGNGDRDDD